MFHQLFAFVILPLAVSVGATVVAKVHHHNLARRRHAASFAGD
jgi:hypothetical protein